MGKHTQARQINDIHVANDKTSPSFKLAHMFHVIDYHRRLYVKKVLAHKKHYEQRHVSECDPKAIVYENDRCYNKGVIENTLFEEHNTGSSIFVKNSSFHSSLRSKSSSSMPFNPTKTSRASRISKMIKKEVAKRKGRHRRNSTCPTVSELERNKQINIIDEGHVLESEREIIPSQIVDEGQKCDLCSSMKIECRLGEKKQAEKQVHQPHQDISKEVDKELPFKGKIDRSSSFHHSNEFLNALCVLGMNKEFSLRVLDDPASSLRNGLLTKQTTRSSNRIFLDKSGSFPINEPLSTKDCSFPGSYRLKAKSYTIENKLQQSTTKNLNSSQSAQIRGRRFKDLRQKIKHLIKENRKERQRIAMDAFLHKVPYGHKVYEDSVKESPCVSICESDFSLSSNSNKQRKPHKKRSSSLDESLDKYCQLFEATSMGKEEKVNTPEISRLRVVDENSSRGKKRVFGRMFSSPDFQVLSGHTSDYYDGNISFISPSRRTMSFKERKMEDDLNVNMVSIMRCNESKEPTSNDFEEYVEINNVEVFPLVDIDEQDTKNNRGDTNIETTIAPGVGVCDSNGDIIAAPRPTITSFECHPQTDSYEYDRMLLKDSKLAQEDDFLIESPSFSCLKVDEDGEKVDKDEEKSLKHIIPPNHRHVRVNDYEIAEFKYVKDILELSGYLGTQVLGTWYSYDQPVDPSVFVEVESCSLLDLDFSSSIEGKHSNHLLLFDMINEVLLAIYERSVSYWSIPLSSCSRTHPMPKGYYVLEEVWNYIYWYMCCSTPDFYPSLDNITTRDLSKYDEWMNLQFDDAECVGLEVEDLIYHDLLNELIS